MKKYTDKELLQLKEEFLSIERVSDTVSLATKIPDLVDEIIRLREYEWKYNDLCR